jgi:hypothetical protein
MKWFLLVLAGSIAVAACGGHASAQTKLVIGYTSVGDVGSNFVVRVGFAPRSQSRPRATLSSEALRAAGLKCRRPTAVLALFSSSAS